MQNVDDAASSAGPLRNTELPPNYDPTDGAAAANAADVTTDDDLLHLEGLEGGGGSGGGGGGGTAEPALPPAVPEAETGTDMEALQRRLAALRR